MKRFFVYKITKNYTLEIEFLKNFVSSDWFHVCNHTMDVRIKGSQKGFYWSLFLLGIKIFEVDIFKNTHEQGIYV